MRQEDLIEALRRRPFQPFRMHVTDGTIYEVRHPEMVLVNRSTAFVFSPAPNLPAPAVSKLETVALLHIIRFDPMETPAAPTNN
ncbi:MAG: hypothetical protein ACJ8FY_27790 [Gemmataceae bacterium]